MFIDVYSFLIFKILKDFKDLEDFKDFNEFNGINDLKCLCLNNLQSVIGLPAFNDLKDAENFNGLRNGYSFEFKKV